MLRKLASKESETPRPKKRTGLDVILERTPDVSLKRLEKMGLGRRPVTGAFSTENIVDMAMDAGAYHTRDEAERGMYIFLGGVVKNGEAKYGWAPLIVDGVIKGYYLAYAQGHEEEISEEQEMKTD